MPEREHAVDRSTDGGGKSVGPPLRSPGLPSLIGNRAFRRLVARETAVEYPERQAPAGGQTPGAAATLAEGIDYGWGNFDREANALKKLGGTFVVRYLSHDTSKNLTRAEAEKWAAKGVSCVVVWESSTRRPTQGAQAGAADATEAASQARACGQAETRPIYFAVDFDAKPEAVYDYFDGVARAIGIERTGAYGGIRVIAGLFDTNRITYGWQTLAWSGGKWDPRAQLRQIDNDPQSNPRGYDRDRAVAGDFGQWYPVRQSTTAPVVPDAP